MQCLWQARCWRGKFVLRSGVARILRRQRQELIRERLGYSTTTVTSKSVAPGGVCNQGCL